MGRLSKSGCAFLTKERILDLRVFVADCELRVESGVGPVHFLTFQVGSHLLDLGIFYLRY